MGAGIVFDLDETLVDRRGSLDKYARALRAAFTSNTEQPEASFVATFHQLDGNGRVPRPVFFEQLSQLAFTDVSADQIAMHFRAAAWLAPLLFDDARAVIADFKNQGYAIGVVTNGGSHSQRAKLENSGLISDIDEFLISEEFGCKKPDPTVYAEIAQRLNIDPALSWFVGDDPISDVLGPHRFGFNTAWMSRYLPWPENQAACYTYRVSTLSQFAEHLLQ